MLVTAAYKNRRRRKRLRQRAESRNAEATGETSPRPTRRVFGAWRPQCGELDRHDLVLVRKACRGDWDVPESVRRAIVGQVCELIGSSRIWLCLSAIKTAVAMERQNQRHEHAAISRLRATPEGRRKLASEIAVIVQGRRTGASGREIGNQ